MDISKIKIGSKTYDLKDAASRTKLAGIESGAQAHKAPTSSEITTALGYTPYNATNPNGYTSNAGTVTGVKVGSSGSTISPSSGVVTIPAYESGAQVHKAPTTAEVKSALGTGSGTSKYLREDGTWATPPDNNTTYSAATTSAAGLMSAADKTKLDGIATGATANAGTITGIKMNGASKGTSGVVDLGTVITAHQDISGKVNTSTTVNGHALTGNVSVTKSDVGLGNVTNDSQVKRSEMGAASGVATLDSSGKVPSSQLPSYVDDVIEAYYKAADGKFYTTLSSGTYSGAITGETGKIYVDLSTSRTYRWGGSAYTEIKASPGTLDDITDGSTYVRMTSAERTKLSGISTGATANTGTITKVGNTSSGAVTVSSSNNTASFGNAVTVGSVGGVDLKFTMPGNPNTNTWRPIQVGGTDKLTDSSTKLNFAGSGATSVSYSGGTVTISSTDNNTVTSINGKTGAIAAADIATVLTGAGYKLTDTDTNTWRPVGTGATDAAAGNHTHTASLASDTGTSAITLAHGGKYKLTAGGQSVIFTMPSDNNTTYSAGTGLSLSSNTFSLATSGVTAGTYKRVTVDSYGRVTAGDQTDADSDTKNTAGTTNNTGKKMFLVGAESQAANPQTYSNSNCYIGTDNCLYSGGAKVLTSHDGNTLNTAGTSNKTGTKLFLAGATSQTDGVQTFSNSNCYVGTDNCLYSGGNKVLTSYTNTTYAAGTGVTISGTNNAINVTYGTAANTACQGNDSRLSNSRPASDVYSWAKAANKPSYAYSEIGYTVSATSSAGGTLSLAGTTPLHVVTLTGNVSALTLSANPAEGHSCHVILTAASAQTVAIAHDATNRVCPGAADISLDVPAGGYVEIDFLTANNKVFVRGV